MGIFNRKPAPLLPPDIGRHLAVYGEDLFAPPLRPGEMPPRAAMAAVLALGKMQLIATDEAKAAQLVDEISDAAARAGGWAEYGAFAAVHAFVPSQASTPKGRALLDTRVRFLRRAQPPGWRGKLTGYDRARWRELFPDDQI